MTESARFTIDGSDAFEKRLAGICDTVVEGVCSRVPPHNLEGILLGGGYGRGEGGVLRENGQEAPYNDMEFYVFVRNALPRRFDVPLRQLARNLHSQFDVEIEFKPISRAKLRRSPPSMFYYDLLAGHHQLLGGPELLDGCAHHLESEKIPLAEATRLLMNRCSGLLFSMAKLTAPRFTAEDADFVARNQAKAQLAFGDVILTVWGQYHWSCRERHRRLESLASAQPSLLPDGAVQHHSCGVEFKLRPSRSQASRKELSRQQAQLSADAQELWLWVESRRLGSAFGSIWDYSRDAGPKFPRRLTRNVLLNLAVFGPPSILRPKLFRDPRERLLETLPLLLWQPPVDWLPLVQSRLLTRAADFHDLVDAYSRLWRQFN